MGYYYQDPKTGSTWWVDDNQTAAQADPWQGTGAAGNTYNGAQRPVTAPAAPQPTTLDKQQQQDVSGTLANGNYSQNAALQAAGELQNSGAAVPAGAQYSTPNANGGLTMAPLPTVPPQTPVSAPAASTPVTSLATGATPHSMVATPGTRSQIPDVTSQEIAGQPKSVLSTIGNGITSTLGNPAAIPVLDAAGLIAAENGIGSAQNALVAGGNQAVGTIQQGATAAQGTLKDSLNNATGELTSIQAQNNAALDPYKTAGTTGLTSLENTKPFSFDPSNLENDPAYQFRLKEGEMAIQNAASAGGGNSQSGATLKGLSDYAGQSASQEYQAAYNRALGTYQENLAVPTELSNLGASATATGVNANTNIGNMIAQITNQYGTSVAGIQTGTANAVANIQTQIASAVAAGDIARANALTQTMSQLAAWAQSQQTLAALKQPPAANTNTNTVNINGQPVTLPDTSKNPLPPPIGTTPGVTLPPPGTPTGTPDIKTTATSTNPDGSTTTFNPNGGTTTKNPDGSTTTVNPDGSKTFTDPSGNPINTGAAPYDPSANPTTLASNPGTNPATAAAGAAGTAGATTGLSSLAAGGAGSAAAIAGAADLGAIPLSTAGTTAALSAGLGAAAPDVAVGATEAAGTTAAGGSGVMSAIGGFLTNPITIGIGAALAAGFGLYEAFKSNTHLSANDFVQKYQNPFGDNLGHVVDQFNAARQQGGMTTSQANQTLDQTKTLVNNFEKTIADWTSQGGDKATVAKQAQKTMDGIYGPNFSNLLGSMQQNIDGRMGIVDDPAPQAA